MNDQETLERIRQGQAHLQPVEEVTPRFLYDRLLAGRKAIQARIAGLLADQASTEEYRSRNLNQEHERLGVVEEDLRQLRRKHGEQLWQGSNE
jgi:hypothetical protein